METVGCKRHLDLSRGAGKAGSRRRGKEEGVWRTNAGGRQERWDGGCQGFATPVHHPGHTMAQSSRATALSLEDILHLDAFFTVGWGPRSGSLSIGALVVFSSEMIRLPKEHISRRLPRAPAVALRSAPRLVRRWVGWGHSKGRPVPKACPQEHFVLPGGLVGGAPAPC